MRRPFDYINDEKIDLQKPEHREIVLKRNVTLASVIKNGVDLRRFCTTKSTLTIHFECYKCGKLIEKEDYFDGEIYYDFLFSEIDSLKCPCCKSEYSYNDEDNKFHLTTEQTINN